MVSPSSPSLSVAAGQKRVKIAIRVRSFCGIIVVSEQKYYTSVRSKQDRIGRFTVTGAVKVRPCRESSKRTKRIFRVRLKNKDQDHNVKVERYDPLPSWTLRNL